MSTANLRSIEALKDVKTSLAKFSDDADMALTEVDMVARRVVEWLVHEQPQHWKSQIRRWEERTAEARNNLQAKRISKVGGRTPDTTEEEKLLRRCQAALQHAQDKAKACKKWAKVCEDEVDEYRGLTAQLSRALDSDVPKAMHALDQMYAALDSYTNLRQPGAAGRAEVGAGAQTTSAAAGTAARDAGQVEEEINVEELIALREKTPTRFKRDSVKVDLPEGLTYDDEGVATAQTDLMKHFRLRDSEVESSQKVLIAEGALDQPKLYLERVRIEGDKSDSGWYIGPYEGRAKAHEATTVGELYEIHPALVTVLGLPEDWLAVVDGTRVTAVLDGANELRKLEAQTA